MQIKAVAKLNMTSLRVVWEAIRHFFMLAPVASQTLMRRRVLDVALVDRHWRRRQLRGGRARTSPGASPSNSTSTSDLAHAPGRELCRLACAAGEDLSRGSVPRRFFW